VFGWWWGVPYERTLASVALNSDSLALGVRSTPSKGGVGGIPHVSRRQARLILETARYTIHAAFCRQATGKVLRGGSFNNNQNSAAAAYRNNNNPNNRNNNNGLRLVVGHALSTL